MLNEGMKISKVREKRNFLLMLLIFLMLSLVACGDNAEKKEKTEIREIAQKYFDALRVGDQEGIYDCYLPVERQNRDAESDVLGFVSKMILKIDLSDLLSDLNTLFGSESAFSKYKYKAIDVNLDEDGMDAVAYVNVYEENELYGSVRVDMTKYDGNWYVVRGTIADDDRDFEQSAADDESSSYDNKKIWMLILIAVFVISVVVFLIVFFRLRSGRKRLRAQPPFIDSSGNKMDLGDILCSCGTINPVGVRACMNCGKKLKKHRKLYLF